MGSERRGGYMIADVPAFGLVPIVENEYIGTRTWRQTGMQARVARVVSVWEQGSSLRIIQIWTDGARTRARNVHWGPRHDAMVCSRGVIGSIRHYLSC